MKTYKFLFGAILIFSALHITAQSKEADSLLKVLDVAPIDSNRLNALMKLGNLYMYENASKGYNALPIPFRSAMVARI